MTEATAQSTTQEKVDYALPILLDPCPTARDLLDLLVPLVAAALEQVNAEPDHVQEFFLLRNGWTVRPKPEAVDHIRTVLLEVLCPECSEKRAKGEATG